MSNVAESIAHLGYAVRWRSANSLAGRHAARSSGQGGDFAAHRPFWQLPDARRIDVRRSMTDPFENIVVRQTENRSSLNVIVAADLSASMRSSHAVATLTQAASRSAHRAGDGFGFIGFDTVPCSDLYLPPTRARSAAADLVARLGLRRPAGRDASGIAALAPLLPTRRSLILLVSDFLMPVGLLEQALVALASHDVAPIVLHDVQEAELPGFGLLRVRDSESGRTRVLLMRPALRRRWLAKRAAWRAGIDALFQSHCRAAFHVEARLDITRLGEYLQAC